MVVSLAFFDSFDCSSDVDAFLSRFAEDEAAAIAVAAALTAIAVVSSFAADSRMLLIFLSNSTAELVAIGFNSVFVSGCVLTIAVVCSVLFVLNRRSSPPYNFRFCKTLLNPTASLPPCSSVESGDGRLVGVVDGLGLDVTAFVVD